MLWVKAVLKALVLPPGGPLLLAFAGLLLLRRRPRLGRWLATLSVGALFALSLPVIGSLLLRAVDTTPALDSERAKGAQAIVILGGGIRRHAAEYGGDTLGRLTLERVRYGARVARQTALPVLVTGGTVLSGTAEAIVMRDALVDEYGVAVQWLETRSRTTRENAVYSSALLRAAGIERVLLVAHGFDMPRAIAEFSREGVTVIPAPTGIANLNVAPLDFLPSMGGMEASYYAIYEILANGVYSLSSRL